MVTYRLSYIPLIAPSTSDDRMRHLCSIADSFIYVVSRMGVTGATGSLSAGIQELVDRVHTYSNGKPAAVGFGVSTRQHFLHVAGVAEGVVIGSQIVITLANAPGGQGAQMVEDYCSEITGRRVGRQPVTDKVMEMQAEEQRVINGGQMMENGHGDNEEYVQVDEVIRPGQNGSGPGLATEIEVLNSEGGEYVVIPSRFGEFGGQYVP